MESDGELADLLVECDDELLEASVRLPVETCEGRRSGLRWLDELLDFRLIITAEMAVEHDEGPDPEVEPSAHPLR